MAWRNGSVLVPPKTSFARGLSRWLGLSLLGLAACLNSGEDLDPTRQAIIGGSVAQTCQWPSAIMILPIGCSGVLVHPRAVITAKHCLDPMPTSIGIGESRSKWVKSVTIDRCYSDPTTDFGICTLNREISDIAIVPVMAPCEMSVLRKGAGVVEVGFGTENAALRGAGGIKKWISATLAGDALATPTIDVTTGSQTGEYFGDSGGPLFFRMSDGTFRVVGEDCCSPDVISGSEDPRISTYVSVPYHVPWAEKVTGLDLTACHDSVGWTGGSTCTGFPVDPDRLGADWSTMCAGQTYRSSGTCGGPDAGELEMVDVGTDVDLTAVEAGDSPASDTAIPNSLDSLIATDSNASVVEMVDAGTDVDPTAVEASDSPASDTAISNSLDSLITTDSNWVPETSGEPIDQAIDAQSPPVRVDAAGGGKGQSSGCTCALASPSGNVPGFGWPLFLILLIVGMRHRGREN